jgi:hypothetical protein
MVEDSNIIWQVVDLDAERTDKPWLPYRSRVFTSIIKALAFCWSVWDDWEEPCIRAMQLDVGHSDDGYLLFLTNGALRPPHPRSDSNLRRSVLNIRDELVAQLAAKDTENL